jgi:hypothetical protein
LLTVATSCDVFVSFATEDLSCARDVVSKFTAAGISCWLAPERIGVGQSFTKQIFDGLEHASVLVLILSRYATSSPWVDMELTQAKANECLILPLKVDEFDVPPTFRMLLNLHQWEEVPKSGFETSIDRLIDKTRTELLRRAPGPQPEPSPQVALRPTEPTLLGVNPDVSPYVGPQPFPTVMADRFFGRQQEAEALLRLIGRSRVTLVYAPSGAGKSSLLNTLITQSLEQRGFDVMLGGRVGGALPTRTKAADIRNLFSYSAMCGLVTPALPQAQWRFVDGLRSIRRKPDTQGRVLIFDQFEELFTQHVERFEDRAAFFEEIVEALSDDAELRVVFAMRQEYLADIDPLADLLPSEFAMQRMVLKRLGPDGALEAVTRPAARYAAFAPFVAETIVWQLNTIRVPGFDSVVVEKRGEFIEMVHLQIVCMHLWSRLPRGITSIEMHHLETASGDGQTFNEFVVNALNTFYDSTVTKVSESEVTRKHGGYSKDLIRLGMMKFVTPAATRTMVPRAHGRVGRLPDWIIEQLENEHLIRFEQRGGQRWYELSHDRLAGPVGRQLDREVSALLFAADLLAKVHENVLLECGNSLTGYFGEHRDVLTECRAFSEQVGLFEDEAEFVFRSSLCIGQDMLAWSRRIAQDYPAVRTNVLEDALAQGSPDVRRHAVELLGHDPVPELSGQLVEVALADGDESVRRAAGVSLGRLDQGSTFDALVDALSTSSSRASAIDVLARIRITADGAVSAPVFEQRFLGLPGSDRRRIRRRAWVRRLEENAVVLAFVFVPAATLAACAAASFKWLPSAFNWSVTQATDSFAMGIFQGVTAGIIWAGLINAGIAFYYVVFGNEHRRKSLVRPFGALVAGAVSGLISSAIIVFLVIGVFDIRALEPMGWLRSIPGVSPPVRFSAEFFADIFIRTRFGLVDLIIGTGLGIGTALATNGIRASPQWTTFLDRERRMTSGHDAIQAARGICRMTFPKAWPVPAVMCIAAVLAFMVPVTDANATTKANPVKLAQGLVGDCATQVIGAIWGLVGMGLGLVVMRSGYHLEPRKNQV